MIMGEIQGLAQGYHITSALVDAYAAGWTTTALGKIGLECERRPGLPQVYANAKSLMIASRLRAPDNGELRAGFINTQAFYGRNNSLSIQHERSVSGHGDLTDACCTAIWAATGQPERLARAFSDADIEAALCPA